MKNNSDLGESAIISFYPISKRFMVWDKTKNMFIKYLDVEIFNLYLLTDLLDGYTSTEYYEDLIVIQSTNLFDKDGKEIFEGSLVENEMGWRGIITTFKGQWIVSYNGGPGRCLHLLYDICRYLKLLGHALSNPELLEEK